MVENALARGNQLRATLVGCVVIALSLAISMVTHQASAGIILPDQISFDAEDLELELNGASSGTTTSSSSSGEHTPSPGRDDSDASDPLSLLRATLPNGGPIGGPSGSSSTSSHGAGANANLLICLTGQAITLSADLALGQLPEDHGLSLPAPLGTDLLKPPRNSKQ